METRPTVVYNFSGIPHPTMVQGNAQGGLPNSNNQTRGGPGNGGQKNQWKGQQGQNQQGNNWKQQGPSGQQRQGPIICYGCGQPGHIKRQCPFNQERGRRPAESGKLGTIPEPTATRLSPAGPASVSAGRTGELPRCPIGMPREPKQGRPACDDNKWTRTRANN